MLDKWIEEKENDPMYEFGAQQVMGTIDPTDQTEDLGNDHIKAGDMAISNLKIIMANFEDWAGEPERIMTHHFLRHTRLISQYVRHVSHVLPYIGGVRFKEVVQGREQGSETQLFHKDDTRRAMEWLLTQSRTNDWLTPAALNSKFEDPVTEWREKVDKAIVATLLSPVNIGRIKTGYEADPTKGYEPATYVDDALKTYSRLHIWERNSIPRNAGYRVWLLNRW